MPSHGFEAQPLRGALAGLVLGLTCALPAQAFTPLSGPVLSASAVAPNVLVLFDNSSSMVINRIDGETRLDIARDVTKEVIAANRGLRFGLFTFRQGGGNDPGPGGLLRVEAGSIAPGTAAGEARFTSINQTLDALDPERSGRVTWTPLAESYYEMTRYLRGLRAFYPQSQPEAQREQFDSPLEYRCQKNFGLVVTDGLPTYDAQFPTTLAQEPDGNNPQVSGAFNLPDWDGDGADVSGMESTEGGTFYLDDIARFAYEIDLRTTGTDQAGQSWNDSQFPRQSLQTYTVGFALDDPRLRQAAAAGNGRYFTATNRQQLKDALSSALQDISAAAGSGGGAVTDSQQLSAGVSRYYQTRFDPADWSGSLQAYSMNAAGEPDTLLWSTDQTFVPGTQAGTFETWRNAQGSAAAGAVPLNSSTWAALPTAQQAVLDAEAALAGLSGNNAAQRLLNWVRGSHDADLRRRSALLGDIINSAPVLVGAGYHPARGRSADYVAYLQDRRGRMTEGLLVGANDGFLRLFDTQGAHLYSYLPAALHGTLGSRARSDYGGGDHHRSGVDGRLGVADIKLGSHWSTLAATGFGAGGKGLAVIRLFDAARGNGARGALWEINATDHAAIGHIYGRPIVAQLHGRSVLVTGNGYGSSAGTGALLIFDLETGALLRQLDVTSRAGASSDNGLSAPVLQYDAAGTARAAFAGDLQGQLWKFDLSDPDPARWGVAHAGAPLFSAAADQPITVPPQLHPGMRDGRDLVLFGTGKFMEAADLTDTSIQAFYAVLDVPALPVGGLAPAQLQEQQIDSLTTDPVSGQAVRTVTDRTVDWNSRYGWYLPLTHNGQRQGERVAREFVIKNARVLFTTGFIKSGTQDPCLTQAGGWLMALDLVNGSLPARQVLDTDDDGRIDDSDLPAAGLELGIGLPGDLNVLDRDEAGMQTGCSGEVYVVQGSSDVAVVAGRPHCQFNRIMWRQLQ
ncbi:protein PilY1 [Pseudomonas saudimassiliensis]|uniref:Protein PilY1 n=1 Tax=Pseudomonas saudimassiliensis TaxID=1461581 RepID=A0A078M2E8_9PSED|nr:PilC/PilY family type IV pilus protein [Pseudomonas saudimassiliensis]CEA00360.1 protein PilY1 [Pseudomonas saudimassiliensis]CEF25131.1 protein PilY1 [Pseudomonas saudimassiliensis]